jgi:myosin heavy subunit
VSQQPSERSYHIFYELVKGASDEERGALGLGPSSGCAHFHYINQSDCFSRLDGVDDAVQYR